MDEAVVLVVKAPNQQIDDQVVHCEANWSVKKLKCHLSEVYPSKPRLEDQKLIYSGQLLQDSSILKDILRVYDGQENYIVHLVCSPPKESLKSCTSSANMKRPATMTSSQQASQDQSTNVTGASGGDGLRHRVYSSPYPPPFSFAQPQGATPPPVWPMLGTYDAASAAQQMAWMQQAYAQYMTQYMQLMASGNVPAGMQAPTSVNAVPPAAPHPPIRDEPAPINEAVANGDDEELRGNRDWLDWFYIMSRMLVLFSIVYFYSSPVRFFLVSTLGIMMYLYQIGFFRVVQRLDQQEDLVDAPPPTPDNNNTVPSDTPEAVQTPPPPPPPPSALAITWAAFSSFFLSLIPEQPNVL